MYLTHNGHVKTLDVGSQLIRGELLLVCYIQIQSTWGRCFDLFHMVHLLEPINQPSLQNFEPTHFVEATDEKPQVLIGQASDQRCRHMLFRFIPAQIDDLYIVIYLRCTSLCGVYIPGGIHR